jgi:hypothetical protein
MEISAEFPKKLKPEWTYNPATPLQGIYPKELSLYITAISDSHVYSSTIHSGKAMEYTWMSVG